MAEVINQKLCDLKIYANLNRKENKQKTLQYGDIASRMLQVFSTERKVFPKGGLNLRSNIWLFITSFHFTKSFPRWANEE